VSEFSETVTLQLGTLPGFRARPMFGGYGLYSASLIFGLIADAELYFYAGPGNIADYEAFGMPLFEPSPGVFMKRYRRVPPDIVGSARELTAWAKKAIEESAKVPRKPKARKPKKRK
jgi:DNA transformation protein and related proteins